MKLFYNNIAVLSALIFLTISNYLQADSAINGYVQKIRDKGCVVSLSDKIPEYVDSNYLKAILKQLAKDKTDHFALVLNNKVILQLHRPSSTQPTDLMSLTKTCVALAMGKLIEEGRLHLTDSIADYIPEWENTPHKAITVQQILEHTSGLYDKKGDPSSMLNSDDMLEIVYASKLISNPGTEFKYNNRAPNLLVKVIEKASGMAFTDYMSLHLFNPLGIQNVKWKKDASGNIYVMRGLHLFFQDLFKIGVMLANDGVYNGQEVISKSWLKTITQPIKNNCHCGKFVWLFAKKNYFDQSKHQCSKFKEMNYSNGLYGFFSKGWLGQYIISVRYPKIRVLVVRQIAVPGNRHNKNNSFNTLEDWSRLIIKKEFRK